MIVNHELGLVVGTPFGCAARLEQAASRGSAVEIVEGVGRYSMNVPERYAGYRRTIAVRNPYERAVLLYLWAQKRMSDCPEEMLIEDGQNFGSYMNTVQRLSMGFERYIAKENWPLKSYPDGHFYRYTAPLYVWSIEMALEDDNVLIIDGPEVPEWCGEPYGGGVDWESYFWVRRGDRCVFREGTTNLVNRLWASQDCCFVGEFEHFGTWMKHRKGLSVCNLKHNSGLK